MNSDQTVFIHVGYPKCLSTTLQRSYFEKHPDIHYGGIGIKDNISFSSIEIEFIFECLLKYANQRFWNSKKEWAREQLAKFIETANKRKIVFSSEHLSMNFSLQGIDNALKYDRINYLFENFDIKSLMITREPLSLIRSIYKEFIKMGYYEEYEAFLKWLIIFKDRNFLYDLNYELKVIELESFFGKGSVKEVKFDSYLRTNIKEQLNDKISNWLSINNLNLEIQNENPSISDSEINKLHALNKSKRRGIGLTQLEPFEKHRNRRLYSESGLDIEESEIFQNVLAKRIALKEVSEMTSFNFKTKDQSKLEELAINCLKEIT